MTRLLLAAILAISLLGDRGDYSTDPLAGAWYTGDITITFRLDGTYEADWFGCLGRYGRASGTWTSRDSIIDLEPKHEEDMLEGYFRRLELVGTEQLYRLVEVDDGGWRRDGVASLKRRQQKPATGLW